MKENCNLAKEKNDLDDLQLRNTLHATVKFLIDTHEEVRPTFNSVLQLSVSAYVSLQFETKLRGIILNDAKYNTCRKCFAKYK